MLAFNEGERVMISSVPGPIGIVKGIPKTLFPSTRTDTSKQRRTRANVSSVALRLGRISFRMDGRPSSL